MSQYSPTLNLIIKVYPFDIIFHDPVILQSFFKATWNFGINEWIWPLFDLRLKVGQSVLYFIEFVFFCVFFFIHKEMALAGSIRAPLGTCSSIKSYVNLVTSIIVYLTCRHSVYKWHFRSNCIRIIFHLKTSWVFFVNAIGYVIKSIHGKSQRITKGRQIMTIREKLNRTTRLGTVSLKCWA